MFTVGYELKYTKNEHVLIEESQDLGVGWMKEF